MLQRCGKSSPRAAIYSARLNARTARISCTSGSYGALLISWPENQKCLEPSASPSEPASAPTISRPSDLTRTNAIHSRALGSRRQSQRYANVDQRRDAVGRGCSGSQQETQNPESPRIGSEEPIAASTTACIPRPSHSAQNLTTRRLYVSGWASSRSSA
jgi:hypothetical protein